MNISQIVASGITEMDWLMFTVCIFLTCVQGRLTRLLFWTLCVLMCTLLCTMYLMTFLVRDALISGGG